MSQDPATRHEHHGPESYAGRLLVAMPQVEADVFARSVVLLLQHTADGAQGVVLNKPVPAGVDSVLPGWEAVTSVPSTLFQGGPVQTDTAIGVVTVPGDPNADPMGVKRLFGAVGVVDLDAPPALVAAEIAGLRVFVGYAGWSPGQLEAEIRRGDWAVVPAEPADPFGAEPGELWSKVLRRQPAPLGYLAWLPDDVEVN